MKKETFWLAINVLAVLLSAVILCSPSLEPWKRIVFVVLLILNSAALPERIRDARVRR